ncbi:MAG TPA: enoyl-CoA hydratase-related protein [Thermodesulfobacteriota bacterium]
MDDGRIVVLTLNRPRVRNAFDTQLGIELGEAIAAIQNEERVRAVVLTGAGSQAFCAGGDLKERHGMTEKAWTLQHRIFEETHRRIRNSRRPVIAAVNGYAIGGGCELALSTDFVIASENAMFGLPEVKRGIIPGVGGTQLLPRFVPRGIAMELLLTGDLIPADEAMRIGLVNRVVPLDRLLDTTLGIARKIAANSPQAVYAARRAVRLGLDLPLDHAIDIALAAYETTIGHGDRTEGVRAFIEKRAPNFADMY